MIIELNFDIHETNNKKKLITSVPSCYAPNNERHEILSLKVPNVDFDFDVPDDILMLGF